MEGTVVLYWVRVAQCSGRVHKNYR